MAEACAVQARRYAGESFCRNGRILPGRIARYCRLDAAARSRFEEIGRRMSLSSRAMVSILRLSRTIQDLKNADGTIDEESVLEAAQYRRFGDGDYFWAGGPAMN